MKLFITDYDGTLYTDDISIKENIKMLKKLQNNNIKVVISTGRSYPSIKELLDKYNIPYDYVSCADGSIIYDNNGNIVDMFFLNNEIIKPFQNFYQKIEYEKIQFSYPEGYVNEIKEDNSQLLGINICIRTSNYSNNVGKDFIKMEEKYPNYNFLNYMQPDFSYLCVKPKGITKSSAIKYLLDKHNLDIKDAYVIGDSYNDYEMIRDYNGVAMSSSYKEILDIAKKTYKSVYDYIVDILKEV